MVRSLQVAVALIAVAFIYELYEPHDGTGDDDEFSILKISSSWKKLIQLPTKKLSRIVIGVNANLDMILSARELLQALKATPSKPFDHPHLTSIAELEQLVLYSMLHCAGLERTFTDGDLFKDIVEAASSLSHTYHVGGNAALMAEKFKTIHPSAQVVLVGTIASKLKGILNGAVETPSYNASSREEVHMILEYSVAEEWAGITSTCANRVIFSHDVSNSKMLALEDVKRIVQKVNPDLVVLSGAHLLESQTQEFWVQRLRDSSVILDAIMAPVHWELATVGNLKFFRNLADTLFSKVESLGLNEQELVSVAMSYNAPFDFANISSKPSVANVSDILHWLMSTFSSALNKQSVLTRVHLHSLGFHVIAVTQGGPWVNTREAVMAGTREAGLQACNMNTFNSTAFKILLPQHFHVSSSDPELSNYLLTAKDGWAEWYRGNVMYYLSPVLVCKNPFKTVGLGDAISASGLLHSQFI